MRTWARLDALKNYLYENICAGREYKAPVYNPKNHAPRIDDFTMAEPRVFLAWQPMRPDGGNGSMPDPYSIAPSITIMPGVGDVRRVTEERMDLRKQVHRPVQMGQTLTVSILFSIYEPGVRLPGFIDSLESQKPDMTLFKDGSEEGLRTLVDWMDDGMQLLLRDRAVPHSDLVFSESEAQYALYGVNGYVEDKRPMYFGFINATFACYADDGSVDGKRSKISELLDY